MQIKSEGLQTWIKTRWGSLYMITDSILRARPVFDWVIKYLFNFNFYYYYYFLNLYFKISFGWLVF